MRKTRTLQRELDATWKTRCSRPLGAAVKVQTEGVLQSSVDVQADVGLSSDLSFTERVPETLVMGLGSYVDQQMKTVCNELLFGNALSGGRDALGEGGLSGLSGASLGSPEVLELLAKLLRSGVGFRRSLLRQRRRAKFPLLFSTGLVMLG